MNNDEPIPIPKELRLKIEKITARSRVNLANLELVRQPDEYMEVLIIDAVRRVCFLPSKPVVSFPTTWWDAFKVRWFPDWAMKRWPAEITYLEARTYFPDLEIPRSGDRLSIHYFDWKEIHRGQD